MINAANMRYILDPNGEKTTKRKSLKWIQPSADENGLTRPIPATQVGKKRRRDVEERTEKMTKKAKLQPLPVTRFPTAHSVKVYCDRAATAPSHSVSIPGASDTSCTCCCHTTSQEDTKGAENEADDLMGKEEVPALYWKELAEQRRTALEDTLRENEQLHKENTELTRDKEELTEENDRLSELAAQAEYFASALNMLTEETCSCSETNEEDRNEETEVGDFLKKNVTKEEDNKKIDHVETN